MSAGAEGAVLRLDAQHLAARVAEIAGLGSRFAGTDGERRGREYVREAFAATGLSDVELEPFAYLGYAPREARCELVGEQRALRATPLQPTADGVAEGEAVYVGDGGAEQLAAVERRVGTLGGKVVVVDCAGLSDAAIACRERGAAALVNIAPNPSGVVGSFTALLVPPPLAAPWDDCVLPFPGVTIDAGDARRLLSLMSSGTVRLRVEHRARYAEQRAANVVGSLPGEAGDEQLVLVGAHYDTQRDCPGAWDNAAGVAALIELAAALRGRALRRTVRFVGFTVEEPGLWGSTSYVQRHADELGRIVGLVNVDTLGSPLGGPRILAASERMRPFATAAARCAGWDPDQAADPTDAFDHMPFARAGVEVCCFLQHALGHPYYHSVGDTPALVDVPRMSRAADAVASTVLRLATADDAELPGGAANATAGTAV